MRRATILSVAVLRRRGPRLAGGVVVVAVVVGVGVGSGSVGSGGGVCGGVMAVPAARRWLAANSAIGFGSGVSLLIGLVRW